MEKKTLEFADFFPSLLAKIDTFSPDIETIKQDEKRSD
jgi:hypothetical protein